MSDERAKPGITMPAPVSAGGEGAQVAARALRGMPFNPHDHAATKKGIGAALEGIDVVSTLNKMQAFDTRITAAPYYERRIKELDTAASGQEA